MTCIQGPRSPTVVKPHIGADKRSLCRPCCSRQQATEGGEEQPEEQDAEEAEQSDMMGGAEDEDGQNGEEEGDEEEGRADGEQEEGEEGVGFAPPHGPPAQCMSTCRATHMPAVHPHLHPMHSAPTCPHHTLTRTPCGTPTCKPLPGPQADGADSRDFDEEGTEGEGDSQYEGRAERSQGGAPSNSECGPLLVPGVFFSRVPEATAGGVPSNTECGRDLAAAVSAAPARSACAWRSFPPGTVRPRWHAPSRPLARATG
jgi:hypothetical protein